MLVTEEEKLGERDVIAFCIRLLVIHTVLDIMGTEVKKEMMEMDEDKGDRRK